MSSSKIYFPFCQGVGWPSSGEIIFPKLNSESWSKALDDRTPIITCFGGFFEHYLSLSIAEALNKIYPSKSIIFNGVNKFDNLINLNGLTSLNNLINEEQIKQYPIPLFFDDSDNIYFNSLYNYLNIKKFNGEVIFKNRKPLSKQLFLNSCLSWDINYIPKFRKLIEPIEFKKWKDSKKFNIEKPFVLIFPDTTDLSIHSAPMLDWTIAQVKSFISMCSGSGINSVIITKNQGRYTGLNSLIIEPNIEQILCLIEKCSVILSNEVDFLLIALTHSINAKIICKSNNKEFSIKKNQKFLQTNKVIIDSKVLNPIDVYKAIK